MRQDVTELAEAAIKANNGSVALACILLESAAGVCQAILDERYYAKHPEERPEN